MCQQHLSMVGSAKHSGAATAHSSPASIITECPPTACCRLGDVCVSPFSVNWDCRKASWSQTCSNNPNQCSFPAQDNGPSSDFLFGQCQFINVTRDQLSLAREVLTVAGRVRSKLPKRNAAVQAAETQYWSGYRISTVGGVAGLVLPIGVAAQTWRPVGGVRADGE
jgi:hypothetical protein